nr:MAG TPA: hypothetical protein [Caudoviricetes sp.]
MLIYTSFSRKIQEYHTFLKDNLNFKRLLPGGCAALFGHAAKVLSKVKIVDFETKMYQNSCTVKIKAVYL